VANWRRERAGPTVHVVVDAAPFTLCGHERESLGPTIWEAGEAASDLCVACSREMLALSNEAVRLTENITSNPERELAREALRALQGVVPDGEIRDLVLYARACIVRGDLSGAHESVNRWRANMRSIGVLPQE
jgi:hypothetical protein